MTNKTVNLIDKLTQVADRLPFRDEQNVARLIVSALENNIISESASSELEPGYFRFVFSGESMPFELCFGKNPNKSKHPTCERATRASEFVTRLLGKIDTEYNFYVVPSEIVEPEVELVQSKLFEGQHEITVTRLGVVNSASAVHVNKSRFEVEFVIIAAMGEHYCRINDSIVTNETTVDGKKTRTYEYTRLEHKELDPKHINSEDAKAALNEAASTVSAFLNDIGGKQGMQIKLNILKALSKAKDSDFYKFLEKCNASGEGRVGDISIYPSAIYVDASSAQTFRYKISLGDKKRFQRAKDFDLDIVCDAKIKKFTPDMPLYVITSSSRFGGLSYSPTSLDGKGKLERLEEYDKLVPVCNVENDAISCESVTLAIPEKLASGANLPDSYKGVSDYAVKLDGTVKYPRLKYYYKSLTKFIDEKRVLAAEVIKCPYSGEEHWMGSFTEYPVAYVGRNGKMGEDKIYRSFEDAKYRCTCDSCQTVYYADKTRKATYDENHKLLDGTGYCEKCNLEMKVGAYPCRLIDAYKGSAGGSKAGKIFARLDARGDFLSVDKGGNVYSCAKCKKTFYYDVTSIGLDTSYECELCCSRYCPECHALNKPTPAKYISNINKYRCPSCPDVGRKITIGKNRGKCLYRVFDYKTNKETLILDDAEKPTLSVYCGNCQKHVYTEAGEERHFCDVCQSPICSHCDATKIATFRKLENTGEYLCKSCPDESKFPIAAGKYQGMGKRIYAAKSTFSAAPLLVLDNSSNPKSVFSCKNCNGLIYGPESVARNYCNICNGELCEKCRASIPVTASRSNKLLLNTDDFFCESCPPVDGNYIPYGRYAGMKLYAAEKNDGTKGYAVDDPIAPKHVFTCCNCKKTIYDTGAAKYCKICGERLCNSCDKAKIKENPYAENLNAYFCASCYDANSNIIVNGKYRNMKVYKVRNYESLADTYIVDKSVSPEKIFTCANCKDVVYRGDNQAKYCDICGSEVCKRCKSVTMNHNEKVVALVDGEETYTHLCKSCPSVGTVLEYSDGSGGAMLYKAVEVIGGAQEREIKVFDDKDDHQLLVPCKNCRKLLYEKQKGNAKRCSHCEDVMCKSCFEQSKVNEQERWSVVFGSSANGAKFCKECGKSIADHAKSKESRDLMDRIWEIQQHKNQIRQIEHQFDDGFLRTVAEEIRLYIPHMNFADQKFLLKKLKNKKNTEERIRAIEECIQVFIITRVVNDKPGKIGVRFKLQVKKGTKIPSTYQFINVNGKIVLENYL